MMQMSKLKSVLNSVGANKHIVRNVTVNSTAVKDVSAATKSWREIPGPSSLPIIKQLHHFLPGGSLSKLSSLEMFKKLHSEYGPITLLEGFMGSPPLIVVFDAESSAQVLRGEDWMPIRPGMVTLEYYRKHYRKRSNDQPTGLGTESGEEWRKLRSSVNPIMLQPKTVKLYKSVLDEVSQDMIARMKSLRGDDNMLKSSLDMEMKLWSLESIGVIALGDRINCLDPNLPDDSPAKKLIQVINDVFAVAEKLDWSPSIWRYYSTPTFKKAMKIYEDEENLTEYFVKKAISKLNIQQQKCDEEKGVLEKLLEIDENIAFSIASDMLFGGVDTTSNTMIFTLYLLAKNPETQEKLREEVMAKQEHRPYLRACIKESLRLMPIVSGSVRQTTKEYNLMGYKIPKDMLVSFCHLEMSLSEVHYKRPEEYIPDRWLVSKDDPLYHGHAHPYAYAPFGYGSRSCAGRRIAELEIETLLARVIENFKVEWFGPPLNVHRRSLHYATGPFNFVFKDV